MNVSFEDSRKGAYVRKCRESSGWLAANTSKWPRTVLGTTRSGREEAFSQLLYLADIWDEGIKWVEKLGHENASEIFELFQAFVRQAKAFYDSAITLDYRSSPLMYYYSFLNLAKALITVENAKAVRVKGHGLSARNQSGDFDDQKVTVGQSGDVFGRLYETLLKKELAPGTSLSIPSLLAFCTDVEYEYQSCGYGKSAVARGVARFEVNQTRKTAWLTLAISNFKTFRGCATAKRDFRKVLEGVEMGASKARHLFDITAEEFSQFHFLETKKEYPLVDGDIPAGVIKSNFNKALQSYFQANLYNDNVDFFLCRPLTKKPEIPFLEPLAIYVIMFYLGTLVRYEPQRLERFFEKREGWIVERFTKSCPETFLRFMSNQIRHIDFVYKAR